VLIQFIQPSVQKSIITTFPLSSSRESIGSELIQLSSPTRSGALYHFHVPKILSGSRKSRDPSTFLSQFPSSHVCPPPSQFSPTGRDEAKDHCSSLFPPSIILCSKFVVLRNPASSIAASIFLS